MSGFYGLSPIRRCDVAVFNIDWILFSLMLRLCSLCLFKLLLWRVLLHDIRHCLASIASLACLHVLFFVSLVSPVPGHASDDVVFQIKMLVCFFFFWIASSNILTWTVGYSKLSSGNFYSIVLCSLGVHSILEDKVNFCWILLWFVFFFFLCMSPDETLDQGRNASR